MLGYGDWNLRIYFGLKHVLQRSSVLDLAKEGLFFGMDRSAYGCDADGFTKNSISLTFFKLFLLKI